MGSSATLSILGAGLPASEDIYAFTLVPGPGGVIGISYKNPDDPVVYNLNFYLGTAPYVYVAGSADSAKLACGGCGISESKRATLRFVQID